MLKQDEDQKEILEFVYKISEKLQKCPIRREKEQKDSFRKIIDKELKETKCKLETDKTEHGKIRNLFSFFVNNIYSDSSPDYKVILMAHYDTPTNFKFALPLLMKLFGASRISLGFYLLISAAILLYIYYISLYWNIFGMDYIIYLLIGMIVVDLFCFLAVTNEHNANDNTSGVITVLAINKYISRHASELAPEIKLVFTDKEEKGLLGAKVFREKLGTSVNNKLILNFDCIGNGSHLNLQYNTKKIDSDVVQSLYNHLEPVVDSSKIVTGKIGGSDYDKFKKEACFGFVFVEPSIFPFGYYIPNMHTNKDTYINEENLAKFSLQISKFIIEYLEKSPKDKDTSNIDKPS